jgi:hypothetical protein
MAVDYILTWVVMHLWTHHVVRPNRDYRSPVAGGTPCPAGHIRNTFTQVNVCFARKYDQVRCLHNTNRRSSPVIVLGIILALIGWLASISILVTIGVILIVVGLILMLLGATGRAVGGRKHWY